MLSCPPASSPSQESHVRIASEVLTHHKIDPNHERPIQCPYCPQRYLLIWDDAEWNSVKDWIRVAEAAVRQESPAARRH